MAVSDVLAGLAYAWDVILRKRLAWKNVRGDFDQLGSDHPAFKRATDTWEAG